MNTNVSEITGLSGTATHLLGELRRGSEAGTQDNDSHKKNTYMLGGGGSTNVCISGCHANKIIITTILKLIKCEKCQVSFTLHGILIIKEPGYSHILMIVFTLFSLFWKNPT